MSSHKETIGYSKCPKWLKEAYTKAVKNICQICHKKKELTPHRIKRGSIGGLYVPNNVLMICQNCHKKIHYKEWK